MLGKASCDVMKGHYGQLEQHRILLPQGSVPGSRNLLLSIAAHVAGFALIYVYLHILTVHILPVKIEAVQIAPPPAHVSFNPATPKSAQPHPSRLHLNRSVRQEHAIQPAPEPASEGTAMQALRKSAREYTAGLMNNFKFRQMYGFSPGPDYQLAFQTAGTLPVISATEVPPRFEQYLIVDIIVDVDGRVADARIESGSVDPHIEHKLLSAIREFKYRPATRDGSPIPCQLGIVVHIPS
jgi:TonB family protein